MIRVQTFISFMSFSVNRALTEFIRSGHLPEVGAPQLNNKISSTIKSAKLLILPTNM